ncbi:MAG TPA: cation diffusion facilitator family transporter [Acetobacteraceae bacterium]|nr:cation diffusion facilitator family transporter [Acetobacteraceae bacterium]
MIDPRRFALGSIAISVIAFGLKLLAWRVSGSAALYSDALEALVNIAASILAFYALYTAAKPADREHPYGHAKAELLSAVAEGALILVAAVLILERAAFGFLHPALPRAPWTGLALNAGGGAFNAAWALALHRFSQGGRFPALAADAAHLFADTLTTIGIIIGLTAAILLRLPVLDPLIAVAIALQIAFIGGRTVLRSLSGLLDEAPPPAITERVRSLVRSHATGALEAHDLRIRQAGRSSFLEFHLVVPGVMPVAEAHVICDRIEAALKAEMPGVIITIHVEPDGKAKHHGVLVL